MTEPYLPPPSSPSDSDAPGGPQPYPTAAPSASAQAPRAAGPRPSMEKVIGDVRGAVSGASQREPYPWLAVAALAFSVIWLMWPEGGSIGASKLKLWTLFVLASALMIFTPMVRNAMSLAPLRAWQFAVAGAGGLAFSWVAFLLPSISTNQAFFGTVATVAAGLAVWTAPGKPE